MAIEINEFKETIDFLLNKKQAGYYSPEDFNKAVRFAVDRHFEDIYFQLRDQAYRGGFPRPISSWQNSQAVTDRLGIFLQPSVMIIDEEGKGAVPDDYRHVSTIMYRYFVNQDCEDTADPNDVPDFRNVDIIDNNRISYRLTSPIVRPSKAYPIATAYLQPTTGFPNGYFQFYPRSLGRVKFDYLRNPVSPIWAYTVVSDEPVYDSSNSVDIEFGISSRNALILYTMSALGINIREQEVTMYSEELVNRAE